MYPNGKLASIWLADVEEIAGLPCTSNDNPFTIRFKVIHLGTDRMTYFYESGHLSQGMVARDVTVQGVALHKAQVVRLDEAGKVIVP